MRRSRNLVLSLAALALAAGATASAPFAASTAGAQTRQCFRALDWHGTAAGGPHDLYVRVGMHDVWHLAMTQPCPGAESPGPVSMSDVVSANSNEICSGVDLQVTVKPRGGSNSTACIVTSMTKLTLDEVKALPRMATPE